MKCNYKFPSSITQEKSAFLVFSSFQPFVSFISVCFVFVCFFVWDEVKCYSQGQSLNHYGAQAGLKLRGSSCFSLPSTELMGISHLNLFHVSRGKSVSNGEQWGSGKSGVPGSSVVQGINGVQGAMGYREQWGTRNTQICHCLLVLCSDCCWHLPGTSGLLLTVPWVPQKCGFMVSAVEVAEIWC